MEAQIAVSSPEQSGRFSAVVHAAGKDSLIARIRFPLGIEGARVLIVQDSAFVYDRLSGVVYRSDVEAMESVLPGSLIGSDMIDEATGFLRPDPEIHWLLSSDSTRYYLHSADSLSRFTIDPVLWRVEHYQSRMPSGELIEQRWYLDFGKMDGVLIPSRSVLSRPVEDTRVSVALRKLRRITGPLDFDLNPKDDVRWVDIRPR